MEQMLFDSTPFEGTRRFQLEQKDAHEGCMRVLICAKGEVGKVWSLLPTDRPTYRYNQLEVRAQHRDANSASYWLKAGVYMIDYWDSGLDMIHRCYLKVDNNGDMAANYSETLERCSMGDRDIQEPLRATIWLRKQFPKEVRS